MSYFFLVDLFFLIDFYMKRPLISLENPNSYIWQTLCSAISVEKKSIPVPHWRTNIIEKKEKIVVIHTYNHWDCLKLNYSRNSPIVHIMQYQQLNLSLSHPHKSQAKVWSGFAGTWATCVLQWTIKGNNCAISHL